MKNLQIRDLALTDCEIIADLNQELGYKTKSSLVKSQIEEILSSKYHYGFVAILENEVIGYIHGFVSVRLTSPSFAEIGSLIVKVTHRNKGIGRKLINHFVKKLKGVQKLRVRCNVKRISTYKFYLALNFQENKEQKVYERNL